MEVARTAALGVATSLLEDEAAVETEARGSFAWVAWKRETVVLRGAEGGDGRDGDTSGNGRSTVAGVGGGDMKATFLWTSAGGGAGAAGLGGAESVSSWGSESMGMSGIDLGGDESWVEEVDGVISGRGLRSELERCCWGGHVRRGGNFSLRWS